MYLTEIAGQQGQHGRALRLSEQALGLFEGYAGCQGLALAMMALARLELEESAAALTNAQRAVACVGDGTTDHDAMFLPWVLARALAACGDTVESRRVAEQAHGELMVMVGEMDATAKAAFLGGVRANHKLVTITKN